jgi:hypothetical protein
MCVQDCFFLILDFFELDVEVSADFIKILLDLISLDSTESWLVLDDEL